LIKYFKIKSGNCPLGVHHPNFFEMAFAFSQLYRWV
jgi:hypothetical protein